MKKILFALSLATLVSGAALADGGKNGKKPSCCSKASATSCKEKVEKTAKAVKAEKKSDRKVKA
ncbi:MAG: hypothetical protein LH606_21055 [Cytophagaceae bacterium]|nr:hypothetical protein [Cytophagaceae bacterium]